MSAAIADDAEEITLGPHKRRPPASPAVGATLVVAPFVVHGNRATTRVAPAPSFGRHECIVVAFHDRRIPSDWLKRATGAYLPRYHGVTITLPNTSRS